MARVRKVKNDPMEKINEPDLNLKFPWSNNTGEKTPTVVVSFRVQPKYVAMLEQLRTNPDSPYYGLFPTQDDLERHLYIHSILAVHNKVKTTMPVVQDIILKERLAAQSAFYAKHRDTMRKNVDMLMDGMEQHLVAGSVEKAVESLDEFIQIILSMDDFWMKEYTSGLLSHRLLVNNRSKLVKESKFLEALEDEHHS